MKPAWYRESWLWIEDDERFRRYLEVRAEPWWGLLSLNMGWLSLLFVSSWLVPDVGSALAINGVTFLAMVVVLVHYGYAIWGRERTIGQLNEVRVAQASDASTDIVSADVYATVRGSVRRLQHNEKNVAEVTGSFSHEFPVYRESQSNEPFFVVNTEDGMQPVDAAFLRICVPDTFKFGVMKQVIADGDHVVVRGKVRGAASYKQDEILATLGREYRGAGRPVIYGTEDDPVRIVLSSK